MYKKVELRVLSLKSLECCGCGATVYPDICSAQTLRKLPRKHVGIYIYIPNNTAGSVETQQSEREHERETDRRGRKSDHSSISVGVHSAAYMDYMYTVSVCVSGVCRNRALFVCRKNTTR